MADAGKLIANNKKAYHDYFIEEKYEAGICTSRHGGKIPAYGKMQHQRSPLSASKTGRC